jgi:hypothetical protein
MKVYAIGPGDVQVPLVGSRKAGWMPNSVRVRAVASSWLVFFGLLAFALLMRGQTFNNPVLGFDEQFYLLVGDRMLQGAIPYAAMVSSSTSSWRVVLWR